MGGTSATSSPPSRPDAATARDSWNGLVTTLQNVTVDYQKVARLTEVTGNLFTDYTIQNGAFKNVRVGMGLNYRGREVIGFRGADTIPNPANGTQAIDDPSVDAFTPVYRPGYYTTTLMFGYARKDWRAAWEGWVYVDTVSDGNRQRLALRERSPRSAAIRRGCPRPLPTELRRRRSASA